MKSKKVMIIVGILLAAVILCSGVLMYLRNSGASSEEQKRAKFKPVVTALNEIQPLLTKTSGGEWTSDTDLRFCEYLLNGIVREDRLSCHNRLEGIISSESQDELERKIQGIRSEVNSHPYFKSMSSTMSDNKYPLRSGPVSGDDGLNYTEGSFSSSTIYRKSEIACNLSFVIYGTETDPNIAKNTKSILSCES